MKRNEKAIFNSQWPVNQREETHEGRNRTEGQFSAKAPRF